MSQRNMNKTMSKKKDNKKNQFDKRRKDNKTLSQKKSEKEREKKTLTEDNKKEGTEDQGSGI
jgi:hypothetical protein